MTDRLFVAVWPDPAAVAALRTDVDRARESHPDLRWQPDRRWHITLAFLGDMDADRAGTRLDRLMAQAPDPPAGPLHLAGAGRFGPIVWVGVEHGPWLSTLATRVQRHLHVADRRFRAHVTVARGRGNPRAAESLARAAVPALADHDGPAWTPAQLTLVASRTGPQPEYVVLRQWALHPGAPATGPVADSRGADRRPG